ncbi:MULTISPECIES: LysM peptidoglycan-binding domain-containing protein [unclassified Arcicella]|uniref:LysM peptidoglycan-binding domain-containing protein n=1 Tax=unclassified Arcicella TaxID=2644986 RepID=UPI00285FE33A|nr:MULTISPECIES: LysM peptidoglycan-binding domain-containing protein [unclassified Arcicella]MDR6560692.1 LysM repeat protein [Arcicella sp. BE51]MDR6810576.1 LysM repeat protein [Arcicella sp. BE140]MDR6821926.1 LysM repeat protein [Arcicella sp. BE139]
MEDYRNPRPVEENSNIPMITLLVLVALVIALLYVGWQSMSDETTKTEVVLSTAPQSDAMKGQDDADLVTAPSEMPEEDVENEGKKASEKAEIKKKEKEEKKVAEKEKEEPKKKEETAKPEKKATEVAVKGTSFTHTVQSGETFYGIANRYHLSKSALQTLNPDVQPEGIKVGITKLNVKVKAIHTVGPGDILRVVAEKYGVSKQLIMTANKKTKDITERGEKLIIPLP